MFISQDFQSEQFILEMTRNETHGPVKVCLSVIFFHLKTLEFCVCRVEQTRHKLLSSG